MGPLNLEYTVKFHQFITFYTANYVFPSTVHKDTVPMSSQFRAKKILTM